MTPIMLRKGPVANTHANLRKHDTAGHRIANSLGRGHGHLRHRRWDDAIRNTTGQVSEAPWQSMAQNRDVRRHLEPIFIAIATCTTPQAVHRIPLGRQMLVNSEEWT